jgi:transcriptional regulator with XRE-family HTH domain
MPESTLSETGYTKLLSDLRKLWETGKANAQRAVSRQLLQTYWEIGGRIAEEKLISNAGYAKSVMERLAGDMRTDMTTLYRCVQFHETYKTVPETEGLAWAHFRVLLTVKDDKEREFYTQQAEKNGWTRDQLLKAVQGLTSSPSFRTGFCGASKKVLTYVMSPDRMEQEVLGRLTMTTLVQEVQDLRKQLGISQEKAAAILRVTTTTLSRWANGKTTEPHPLHQEWSDALNDLLKEASEVINPKSVAWWFNTPNALLSDLRPLDLLGSPAGYKKVKNLLFSMRWGLPV